MHVHRTRLDHAFVSPDALEQAVARDHAIFMLYEITEELELAPRQPDRRPVHGDGDGVEIGKEVRALISREAPGFRTGHRGRAPQDRADSGRELAQAERL